MRKLLEYSVHCVGAILVHFFFLSTVANAASTANRVVFPAQYTPGAPVTVTITVIPDSQTLAYAVEEMPPPGWLISNVNNDGVVNGGAVKWGLFFDSETRTFTYTAIPSVDEAGLKRFFGKASLNGNSIPIAGLTDISDTQAEIPKISAQPSNQTVATGQTATFSISANAESTSAYQWKKNGVAIADATSNQYTTPPTTLSDNGAKFSCVVSNVAGSVTSSEAVLIVQGVTSSNDAFSAASPIVRFEPFANIFNPAKGETMQIRYSVALPDPMVGANLDGNALLGGNESSERVRLSIVDRSGREVLSLFDGNQKVGPFTLTWDGRNANGNVVASGMYVILIKTENNHLTRKVIVAK